MLVDFDLSIRRDFGNILLNNICTVPRCGYTGEDGVELSCPAEQTEALAQVVFVSLCLCLRVCICPAEQTDTLAHVGNCIFVTSSRHTNSQIAKYLIYECCGFIQTAKYLIY